jgi:polysaccharide pyruvyl transferase WcaK-like protein
MKIAIVSSGGVDNFGERAIMLGTLHYITDQYPGAQIGVFGYNNIAQEDPPLAKLMQANNVILLPMLLSGASRKDKLLSVGKAFVHPTLALSSIQKEFLTKSDIIYAKGQETLTENYGFIHFIDSIWDAYIASRLNKRVILLGHSIGPISTTWGKAIAKHTLKKVSHVQVRDTKSRKELAELGYPEAQISQDKDMAYIAATRKSFPAQPHRKHILIIPNAALPKNASDEANYIENLRTITRTLLARKEVVLIGSSVTASDWNNDYRIANTLIEDFPSARLVKYSTLDELLEGIYNAKTVISSRLHPIILSDALNTPFIALTDARKVLSLIADAGKGERTLAPYQSVSEKELVDLLS